MSNVISRVAPGEAESTAGQLNPTMDITLLQVAMQGTTAPDYLRRFPTEVRLMIFEALLVTPKAIFRGAYEFGPLDENEFDEEIEVHWQILLTCREYFKEAMPILYGKNKFVFCTGEAGDPGMFWRFPIHRRYMPYVNNLSVFFRADDPRKESAKRVAHFLKAINRHATKLEHLTVMVSSDRFYEGLCPFDILFGDHPVAKELLHLVEAQSVKNLKIRLHDGACFFPLYAGFLAQTFMEKGANGGRSITFTRSCTCPPGCPEHPTDECTMCGWPKNNQVSKPVEWVLPSPGLADPCMQRLMDMEDDLFQLGIWPGLDEDDEEEDEEDDEKYLVKSGPYKILAKDIFEELRPAFFSGLLYRALECDCETCRPERGNIVAGQEHRYRGKMTAPKVWYFRQTKITEFFKPIQHENDICAIMAA